MRTPHTIFSKLASHAPTKMVLLFSLKQKRDVENYLKTITITLDDFSRTVYSCHLINYSHEIKKFELIPDVLKTKTPDLPKLFSEGKTKQAVGILNGVFEQRRIGAAHLLENRGAWHIFYFNQRDMAETNSNHWTFGAHVHFVNYLWSNLKKETVWGNLGQKNHPSYGEHVRFSRK